MAKAKAKAKRKYTRRVVEEMEDPEEKKEKRADTKRYRPSDSDTGFQIVVEDFLPSLKRNFKPYLKEAIKRGTSELEERKSFFIPQHEMGVSTVRTIVKEEMDAHPRHYKNKDIRVVASKKHDKEKGCRVSRYPILNQ